MSIKRGARTVCAVLILLLMAGCANLSSSPAQSAEINSNNVSSTLQYRDQSGQGPLHSVMVTVPDNWVGSFTTRNVGNVVYFDYTGGEHPAEIFSIEALSPDQYWKASGAQPNSHTNLRNVGDTFFVYHLPIDAYYSGLPEDEFAELSAEALDVVLSFSSESLE